MTTPTPSIDDKYLNLSLHEIVIHARTLWLSASKESDLQEVENLYRHALRTNQQEKDKRKRRKVDENLEDDSDGSGGEDFEYDCGSSSNDCVKNINNKKRKSSQNLSLLKPSECKKACEKLALLHCQSGRSKKAKAILARLGYVCRLSGAVLDYDVTTPIVEMSDEESIINKDPINGKKKSKKIQNNLDFNEDSSAELIGNKSDPPCCVLDYFVSKHEIKILRSIFESTTANYWTSHDYAVEPPSPYFSYIIPLKDCVSTYGFVGELIHKIYQNETLRLKFPKLKEATKVEMWAHNRPHASGHQMHFDSDDEGRGGVRNPIISTIIYITAGCGGPSLVTNQTLQHDHLATKGWLCYPKCERLVAFDGRYLHGVIPGKGVQSGRRVTLMFAFWCDIRTRDGEVPGSARPFPHKEEGVEWAHMLTSPGKKQDKCETSNVNAVEADPIRIDRVYETLGGKKWSKSKGFPQYDSVFQGF